MLDFRKLFLALAILTIASGAAFAQPLNCVAQAAGTPSIRAEGVTELVGDVIISCSGGTPSLSTEFLRQVNIQVFSSPSINITSRHLNTSTGAVFTEALLFIDEPAPLLQTICGSTDYPNSIPGAAGSQVVVAGVCGAHTGSGTAGTITAGATTYDPTAATSAIGGVTTYRGNAYQARSASNNSLIWQGIPFDAPGTFRTRTLRMTNVRVNASQLGVPAGSQASVSLVVSTSASGIINPIALPITNPAPTVAIAQNSLSFSVVDPRTCLQCESKNKDFVSDNTKTISENCGGTIVLRYTELFPSVWRRRSNAPATTTQTLPTTPPISQDLLSTIYQTESGFYKDGGSTTTASRWPGILSGTSGTGVNTSKVSGTSDGTLGLADHGTRIIARFTNVQNGLNIYLPNSVRIFTQQALGSPTTGQVTMTTTDPNGAGPFSATPVGSTTHGITQISIVGGTGQAVYEVINADTTAIERIEIPLTVAYVANTSANLPSLGTSSANGNLAPISTVATGNAGSPLPRFVDTAANRNLITVNSCRSNILFPFVSNQAGFDTGLAIANTSKDPFGTALQTGACTVNFYGNIGNSKVCLSHPSPSITGGEHFVWSLSSGGAVTATAGFQGYVIAQCQFQYGHGYAFISDLGSQRLAMGYLALIMDDDIAGASRTGSTSETLGH